jgi:outer membrane immunogenic protein
MKKFLGVIGVASLIAGPAFAADLYTKAPAAVAPAYLDEWSGVYVGLEGGYGWGKQKFDNTSIGGFGGAGNIDAILTGPTNGLFRVLNPQFTLGGPDSIKQNGGLFGGFAGVQKQMGNWVLGLEVDFDASWMKGSFDASSVQRETVFAFRFANPVNVTAINGVTVPLTAVTLQTPVFERIRQATDVTRTLSVESKIDELGSARGKIGFTPAPSWLLYATGGLAFAHVENNINATESFTLLNANEQRVSFDRTVSHSGGATLLGAAVGGGVDWKLTPNWILGVEYLHYEFPKHTISLVDGGGATASTTGRETVDAVKGRISYLFPIH